MTRTKRRGFKLLYVGTRRGLMRMKKERWRRKLDKDYLKTRVVVPLPKSSPERRIGRGPFGLYTKRRK